MFDAAAAVADYDEMLFGLFGADWEAEAAEVAAAEADIANMANGGSRVTSRGRDDEGSRSAGHLDAFVLLFDAFEADKDVFEVFCTRSR